MNNYEKIKKMSVDEMAEFFFDIDRCSELNCSECRVKRFMPKLCGRTTIDSYKDYFLREVDFG